MTSQRKLRPARWRWVTENGKSGLRPRPPGSLPGAGLAAPERDVITAPIPTLALLQAARAMTDPEPPIDLGLYRALEQDDWDADEADEAVLLREGVSREEVWLEAVSLDEGPRSSRRSRPAPPLAAEFGLDHLIDAELRPRRNWSLWVRAHSLWIAMAVLLLWLVTSFAVRWLSILP
jgi:hypothetical protein